MRIVGRRDEAVLHAMGADMCAEVRDEHDEVIGHDVEPAVDMANYDAVAARLAKDKSGHRWDALRARRDALLAASDHTQLPDRAMTPSAREAWASYRRLLRDLPENTEDPMRPSWPVGPS